MLMFVADAAAASEALMTINNLVALLTLTSLEIVLGIDNIVFIAILCGKLPPQQRGRARTIGLALALVTRVLFLLTVTWIVKLASKDLFVIPGLTEMVHRDDGTEVAGPNTVTGKDLILILGGLFLLWKATKEIHGKLEVGEHKPKAVNAGFWAVVAQILVIDIVFSIDSVVTAVGMAQRIEVMVAAVVISVIIMLVAAGPISAFIERHPSLKVLALSFLILIGFTLVAEGLGQHISKGYIYFAMAFSLAVEIINIRTRRKAAAH